MQEKYEAQERRHNQKMFYLFQELDTHKQLYAPLDDPINKKRFDDWKRNWDRLFDLEEKRWLGIQRKHRRQQRQSQEDARIQFEENLEEGRISAEELLKQIEIEEAKKERILNERQGVAVEVSQLEVDILDLEEERFSVQIRGGIDDLLRRIRVKKTDKDTRERRLFFLDGQLNQVRETIKTLKDAFARLFPSSQPSEQGIEEIMREKPREEDEEIDEEADIEFRVIEEEEVPELTRTSSLNFDDPEVVALINEEIERHSRIKQNEILKVVHEEVMNVTSQIRNNVNLFQGRTIESWRDWILYLREVIRGGPGELRSFLNQLIQEWNIPRLTLDIWQFFTVLYDPSANLPNSLLLFDVNYNAWKKQLQIFSQTMGHPLNLLNMNVSLFDFLKGPQLEWLAIHITQVLTEIDYEGFTVGTRDLLVNYVCETEIGEVFWRNLSITLQFVQRLWTQNLRFQDILLETRNWRKTAPVMIGQKKWINFYPMMVSSSSAEDSFDVILGDTFEKMVYIRNHKSDMVFAELHVRIFNRFSRVFNDIELFDERWVTFRRRWAVGENGVEELRTFDFPNTRDGFRSWFFNWLAAQCNILAEKYDTWMLDVNEKVDLDYVGVDKVMVYVGFAQGRIPPELERARNSFVWARTASKRLFKQLGCYTEVTNCGICLFESFWTFVHILKIAHKQIDPKGRKYFEKAGRKMMIMEAWQAASEEEKLIVIQGDVEAWIELKQVPRESIIHWEEGFNPQGIIPEQYYFLFWDYHCFVTQGVKVIDYFAKKKKEFPKDNLYWKPTIPNKKEFKGEHWFLDIETCLDKTGKFIPYLICLKGEIVGEPQLNDRWDDLDNHLNHREQIFWGFDCVDKFRLWLKYRVDEECGLDLGKKKGEHRNIIIWTYNGNKFDLIFLIKHMVDLFGFDLKGSVTSIKALSVSNIVFKDLLNICPFGSLDAQSKFWDTPTKKGSVNHDNITEEWVGSESSWSLEAQLLKQEIIQYCLDDCQVLKECTNKMLAWVINNLGMDTDFISTAGMAFRYFTMKYMKYPSLFPQGLTPRLYDEVKRSYKGGIVLVIKKENRQGTKLCKLDVNSMYPAAMLLSMPYRYKQSLKFERGFSVNNYKFVDHWLYGIDTLCWKQGTRIPTIPHRGESGSLNHVLVHEGVEWIWGKEINFALKTNNIASGIVIACHQFDEAPIFKEYIEKLYSLRQPAKANGDKIADRFYKLLMNSLYGKFGQKLYPSKILCSTEQVNLYSSEIVGVPTEVIDGIWSLEINDFGEKFHTQVGGAIHLASYITAVARTLLMDGARVASKEWTLDNLVYFDTDCIIMEYENDSVDFPLDMISKTELGKWDIEGKNIVKGLFPAKKLYYLQYEDGKEEKKSKGVKASVLTKEHYEKLVRKESFSINSGMKFVRKGGYVLKGVDIKSLNIEDYRDYRDGTSMPYTWL